MSEWIPVTERMPDNDTGIWIWNGKIVEDRWFSAQSNFFFTHWMPFKRPEPPKKKEHSCFTFLANCYEKNSKLRVKGVHFDFPVNYCPFCGYNPEDQ